MHFTDAVILKSLVGPAPGHTLNNLNPDRRLHGWPLGQMGDLHSKDITYCRNNFRYQCCSFPIVVTQVHLAHLAELGMFSRGGNGQWSGGPFVSPCISEGAVT